MTDGAPAPEALRLDLALERLRRAAIARMDGLASAGRAAPKSRSGVPVGERPPVPQAGDEGLFGLKATAAPPSGIDPAARAVPPPTSPATSPPRVSVEVGLSTDSATAVPLPDPSPQTARPERTGDVSAASPPRQGFWAKLLQSRWTGGG